MLVLFILLVSASFTNTESSIYLKRSLMGRVLLVTRGSIGDGQGERWEQKDIMRFDCRFLVITLFLVFVIAFVSG